MAKSGFVQCAHLELRFGAVAPVAASLAKQNTYSTDVGSSFLITQHTHTVYTFDGVDGPLLPDSKGLPSNNRGIGDS